MKKQNMCIVLYVIEIMIIVAAATLIIINQAAIDNKYDRMIQEYTIYKNKKCESCKLCDLQKVKEVIGVEGVYYQSEDFYCIWTKNKDPISIKKAEAHEMCHHLVAEDYNHFCN